MSDRERAPPGLRRLRRYRFWCVPDHTDSLSSNRTQWAEAQCDSTAKTTVRWVSFVSQVCSWGSVVVSWVHCGWQSMTCEGLFDSFCIGTVQDNCSNPLWIRSILVALSEQCYSHFQNNVFGIFIIWVPYNLCPLQQSRLNLLQCYISPLVVVWGTRLLVPYTLVKQSYTDSLVERYEALARGIQKICIRWEGRWESGRTLFCCICLCRSYFFA